MQKPKIICPGLGRTGTSSMKEALEILGFGPSYHFRELINNPEHISEWYKLKDGKKLGKSSPLFRYNSFMDFPIHTFYKDLASQFDNYKIILTVRDFDELYNSHLESIYKASPGLKNKLKFAYKLAYSRRTQDLGKVLLFNKKYYWRYNFEGRFKDKDFVISAFKKHNQKVKETFKDKDMLIFDVKNGWKKLCDFLNVPVPNQPFPHLNKKENFNEYARSEIGNFLKSN